jgi:hypothetical protein
MAQVRVRRSELLEDLPTWEDYTALKQDFPQTPTWGQIGFQEPGNVRTNDQDNSNEQHSVNKEGPRWSSRPKKPNVRMSGSEWG